MRKINFRGGLVNHVVSNWRIKKILGREGSVFRIIVDNILVCNSGDVCFNVQKRPNALNVRFGKGVGNLSRGFRI